MTLLYKMPAKYIEQAHVLVIEDQPLAQSTMRQALEKIGLQNLAFAEHAHSAIALCQTQQFDVILCSFNLGRDKDGYQLYDELKSKRIIKPSTGFIFISAETSPSLVHSVLELQPDDFLAKPFTPKELSDRINRVLRRKAELQDIYQLIDDENHSKAIKLIDEKLNESALSPYSPILLRLKGESLLRAKRIAEAITFFKSALSMQKFVWAKVGLVEALIRNNEFSNALGLLEVMLQRSETRLVALALLGELEAFLKHFEKAQSYLSEAAELAPRNLKRQDTLATVAKINHDYEQSFKARRDILKFAKHSIYEKPDIYLNVARAGVDFALTTDQPEVINRLTRQSMESLNELKKQFPNADTQEQIDVLNARIHYLKDERQKAQQLIAQIETDDMPIRSIESALDKAKAFHELGLLDKSKALFAKITEHCKKHSQDETLLYYLEQEQKERQDITLGPKDLNNQAVELYQRGQYSAALAAFNDAFRIMPNNISIALNLLQTMLDAQKQGATTINSTLVKRAVATISKHDLQQEQAERFAKISDQLVNLGVRLD